MTRKDKLISLGYHGVFTLLYASGMLGAVLSPLGVNLGSILMLCSMVTLVLCCISLHKIITRIAGLIALVWCVFALLSGWFGLGIDSLVNCARFLLQKKMPAPQDMAVLLVVVPVCACLVSYLLSQFKGGLFIAMLFAPVLFIGLWVIGVRAHLIYSLPIGCALGLLLARRHVLDLMQQGARPASAMLSLLILLPALLLTQLLMPKLPNKVQPLKFVSDAFEKTINDLFFFTGPRMTFSLGTVGFEAEGGALGGPVFPVDLPVLRVNSSRPLLLRGSLKNAYDGTQWTSTIGDLRYYYNSLRWISLRTQVFGVNVPSEALMPQNIAPEFPVQVSVLSEMPNSLFVPNRMLRLRTPWGLTPYFNDDGEIFATRSLAKESTYRMQARVIDDSIEGIDEIIARCEITEDDQFETILYHYAQNPNIPRVQELADRLTAQAASPYEKAKIIKNYLKSHFPYTLTPSVPPTDMDFVEYFLFYEQQGYCTYFASSLAILARCAGIPARYVEGFQVTPDATGVCLVKSSDAHAWVELYFKGFGWLTMDATPGGGDPIIPLPDEEQDITPIPSPTPEPTPTPTLEPPPDQTQEEIITPPPVQETPPPNQVLESKNDTVLKEIVCLLLFTLLLLFLFACFLISCVALVCVWRSPWWRSMTMPLNKQMIILWLDVSNLLTLCGVDVAIDDTPLTLAIKADEAKVCHLSLESIALRFVQTCYGQATALSKDAASLRRYHMALRTQARAHLGLKYYTKRARQILL